MAPEGWSLKKLSQVIARVVKPVQLDVSAKYEQIGIRSHGKGIFYKEPVTGLSLGNKRVFWVEPDCFIVNIVFAWEQAVARTTIGEVGKIASHRFPMYRPVNDECDVEYLRYLFLTGRGKHLLALASPGGAGRNKTLGQKEFERLTIALPPTPEQKKIAEILSTWDKAIETTEKLLANAEAHKRALMQQLLTGKRRLRGTAEGSWKHRALGALGETYGGLAGKSKEDFGQGKPFITYMMVFSNARLDLAKVEYVGVPDGERQHQAQRGDIFFTTSSETPNEIGMASVLLDDVDELYLNSFCFGFRLHHFNSLLPEYAGYLLRGPAFRRNIRKLAQGATRYNLSKRELMKLEVLLPSVGEQVAIVEVLNAADKTLSGHKAEYERLHIEKKALMQQLLTGKKRVTV